MLDRFDLYFLPHYLLFYQSSKSNTEHLRGSLRFVFQGFAQKQQLPNFHKTNFMHSYCSLQPSCIFLPYYSYLFTYILYLYLCVCWLGLSYYSFQHTLLDVVVHTCNPIRRLQQKNGEFKASLGHIARLSQKAKKHTLRSKVI